METPFADSRGAGFRRGDLIVCYPDEILHDAATRMLRNDIGRLPVVSRNDAHRLVGYLGRANLMTARLRQLDEEHLRERGLRTVRAVDASP